MKQFELNKSFNKRLFIVDNFYNDPNTVRDIALSMEFVEDLRYYKGLRSTKPYRSQDIKSFFETIIGEHITNWEGHGFNGCFQITTAEDPQVYHCDMQKWAAMVYLTPNAPYDSGTRLHIHKETGLFNGTQPEIGQAFAGGFYDSTKFDTLAMAGNVFNRLVIMDARNIHSAGTYFGNSRETGRLVQLFFFD
jgi:hypothetical protein